ncbi:DNA-binding protein [Prunus dulcis]|uniref:DNA-binding protein n=1 Tax=Prunus dulcis TaxID=3755 RepID=A0A4Y1RVU5_PRUDU|nr:DNA-binding protein [Prunus dulcis]
MLSPTPRLMELQKAQLSSTFYRPSLEEDGGGGREEQPQAFDRSLPTAEDRMSVDQCEAIGDLDDSRLVGVPQTVAGGGMVAGRVGQMMADVAVKVAAEKSLGKRRRGRPPSGHVRATPVRKQNEEEDVCFICFDGGSLVLCDRRGCPKAYHPSCIKRDESFFRSKAKWNCGWHICSSCQKASHYWCYTCTYSLCKGCTKDADYQCVRGNKGFCGTCMRTIMLIENVQGNKEVAQVDFDDKSSWEYLFKVYWSLLKGKLSLTLDELINAKNPWKGGAVVVCKRDSSGALAFVAHMKNGDISVLSQFDVQALLLEYIKKNSLRDPRRKCQIVCDSRLINLFGRECVGHFEMLKLLESHFLIKESSRADNISSAAVVTSVSSQMEFDGIHDNQMMMGNDKRRKTRKRVDEKGPQTNPAAYAAIDVHNINLIYLSRNWMEILIEDIDKFHEKVVGSVVRIRISSGDQKQEIYRLVQVIGTSKVAEPYKIGTRTTDVKLEILNLDKKEVISIDEISNQEFTQDECKRLRQSIRCGLTKRLTVGEIQEKAMALQAVRVNDFTLRECVEKLQLLNSPEERQRRLHETQEVHPDPSMDPSYESEDSAGDFNKDKGREPFPQPWEGDISNNIGGMAQKNRDKIWHYHDPTGKIQGPFAMIQLRKWSTTGHFPLDHRIWRINEKPDDSILLADAVNGQYYKELLLPHDSHLLSQGFTVAMDERNNGQDAGSNKSMNATEIDGKKVEESWNTKQDGQSLHNNGNVEPVRCTTPVDVVNSNEEQTGNHLQGQDPLKGNSSSPNKAQESGSLPSPVVPVKPYETLEGESRGAENNSDQNNGNLDPPKTAQGQIMNGQCTENRSDSEGHSGQSSGQNWRPPPVSSPSNGCDSNSDLIPLSKSCETSEQDQRELSFPDIPSPTPKPSNGDLLGQAAENKQSVSSNFPVQDSGPSWSTASSLGGGGAQLPEVGGEWGGYSPTPAKPTSLEEWESSLVSASSLKPSEMAGDCVTTAVSVSGQLTHSSPSHPTSNASGWQDILTGSTEFCTLAGESVSDLLAEVEAMESLSGLATPTSIMNCGGEFTEGSKNESISSVEGFSPPTLVKVMP